MTRKIIRIVIYVFLFFSVVTGCNSFLGIFRDNSNAVTPDYTGLQKKAEYFSTIFLDWNKPLDDRKEKMQIIAPTVVPYLVSGKQSVQYVEAGTPYFSKDLGYVDVNVIVKAIKSVDGEDNVIFRNYKLSVYFVNDTNGDFIVERMPLVSIVPITSEQTSGMDKEQRSAAINMEPTLEVFLPALLSGDLRSVQTLIRDNAQIVTFKGEYEFLAIKDINVRQPSSQKEADYAADVVLKVKDVELNQIVYIQVYVWVKEDGDKFYVVRANL